MPKEQNGGLSFRLGQSFLSLPSIHPLWEGFGSQCLLGSTNLQLARESWEPDRSLLLSRWSVSRFWTFQDFAGSARSVRNPSDGNLWQQVSFLSSIFWQSMRIYIVGWFISLPLSLWLLVSRNIFVYWIYWIVLHTHVYTNMYIYNILYIYYIFAAKSYAFLYTF